MSRAVVVTGGSSGIGRAVAARFLAAGDRVTGLSRRREPLEHLESALHSGAGGSFRGLACDVTDEEAVAAAFVEIGPVDVLDNSAGASASARLERTELASWNEQIGVNATGAFLCTRAVLPGMRERDRGAIVTVASTAARVGAPYTAAYAASKHAALGLMRATAAELAGTAVRANAVCPTFVDTPMTDRSAERISSATGRGREESRAALAARSPLGRLLDPQEVAEPVFWLASDAARAVNGQALVLDGGGIQA